MEKPRWVPGLSLVSVSIIQDWMELYAMFKREDLVYFQFVAEMGGLTRGIAGVLAKEILRADSRLIFQGVARRMASDQFERMFKAVGCFG